MKLPADGRSARFVKLTATLIAALALGACGIVGGSSAESLASAVGPSQGPQGDYPVIVGEPSTSATVMLPKGTNQPLTPPDCP